MYFILMSYVLNVLAAPLCSNLHIMAALSNFACKNPLGMMKTSILYNKTKDQLECYINFALAGTR